MRLLFRVCNEQSSHLGTCPQMQEPAPGRTLSQRLARNPYTMHELGVAVLPCWFSAYSRRHRWLGPKHSNGPSPTYLHTVLLRREVKPLEQIEP